MYLLVCVPRKWCSTVALALTHIATEIKLEILNGNTMNAGVVGLADRNTVPYAMKHSLGGTRSSIFSKKNGWLISLKHKRLVASVVDSAIGGNLTLLKGRLDLGATTPFSMSEELGVHIVWIGLGGFNGIDETLVAHAMAVFLILLVGWGATVLDVKIELDGYSIANGLDNWRAALGIVEEVGDFFGRGRTFDRRLEMDVLETGSDTRVQTKEAFEVDDTRRIDGDLGDWNASDRAVIRRRDGETVGHRVKERVRGALVQPLAQKSNGLVSSPSMGDQAIRIDAVLLMAGEGRLDEGTLLPLRRAAELERTQGRFVGHSLDCFDEGLDIHAVHVCGFVAVAGNTTRSGVPVGIGSGLNLSHDCMYVDCRN